MWSLLWSCWELFIICQPCQSRPPAMSRAQFYISLVFLLSWMGPTAQKVLLVKVLPEKTAEGDLAASGEDFREPFDMKYTVERKKHYAGKCPGCTGKCRKDVKNGIFGSTFSFSCEAQAPPPPPPPQAPPTTEKPTSSCYRTPRNEGRTQRYEKRFMKKQGKKRCPAAPWGHWTALRNSAGESFCCSRGPRSGATVRTPRQCRTPRKKWPGYQFWPKICPALPPFWLLLVWFLFKASAT